MQPHPVSLVKPSLLPRLRSLVVNDMWAVACGCEERGIAGKLERYVSQILLSRSSRNSAGQPRSASSSACAESDGPRGVGRSADVLSVGVLSSATTAESACEASEPEFPVEALDTGDDWLSR